MSAILTHSYCEPPPRVQRHCPITQRWPWILNTLSIILSHWNWVWNNCSTLSETQGTDVCVFFSLLRIGPVEAASMGRLFFFFFLAIDPPRFLEISHWEARVVAFLIRRNGKVISFNHECRFLTVWLSLSAWCRNWNLAILGKLQAHTVSDPSGTERDHLSIQTIMLQHPENHKEVLWSTRVNFSLSVLCDTFYFIFFRVIHFNQIFSPVPASMSRTWE